MGQEYLLPYCLTSYFTSGIEDYNGSANNYVSAKYHFHDNYRKGDRLYLIMGCSEEQSFLECIDVWFVLSKNNRH